MDLVSGLLGALMIVATLVDIVVTVALPRRARLGRISRWIWRESWKLVRGVARWQPSPRMRESILGGHGPLSVFLVLGIWLLLIVTGYGLIV